MTGSNVKSSSWLFNFNRTAVVKIAFCNPTRPCRVGVVDYIWRQTINRSRTEETKMATVEIEELIDIYKKLLAGVDYDAVTVEQKEAKRKALESIAYAEKMGYQIEIPNV